MRRIAVIVAAVAAVIVLVVLARSSSTSSTHGAPVRDAQLAVPHAAGLEPGVEHAYEVSLVQTARRDKAADFRVALDGTWAVTYAGTDERGLLFRAELRDARPTVQRGDVDATSAFAATLAKPYYFTTTPQGRLVAMQFDKSVDELARGALTTVAAMFQVTHSTAVETDAVESDTLGDYEAHYTRGDRGLHKSRVRYQRVVGGGAIAATIVKTGTEIALRDDGWPAQLAGTEVTRVGTDDLGITVDTRFTLRHHGIARVAAGSPTGLDVVAVDAASGAARTTEQADRELVDGASLADLLAELERVGDDAHARGYQFLRIAALMRLDDGTVQTAERAILAGEPASPVLIAALGEAGTPTAQRSLGSVLASTLGDESRTHAAISLGLVDAPTPATLDALARATQDPGDLGASATLAQGNAALRMRDDDPAAAVRQVDELVARLGRATTDDERALVVRALGNTGDPRIVPALQVALASRNPIVRVAATEALRLVPDVDALVLARFTDDAAVVRATAVFAASQRDLAVYLTTFDRIVHRDPEADVRRAVVELAGARIGEHAALRAIVEYAAAHDADAELRETAQKFLAPTS